MIDINKNKTNIRKTIEIILEIQQNKKRKKWR